MRFMTPENLLVFNLNESLTRGVLSQRTVRFSACQTEFNKFKQILNKIDPISLIHFPGLSVQIK